MSARAMLSIGVQVALYVAFGALILAFASGPTFRPIAPGEAQVTISFAHLGQRVEPCRQLTMEELRALPPNMRVAERCPRERFPITVEMSIDDRVIYSETVRPSGLHRDGYSYVHDVVRLSAGEHRLSVRLRDHQRNDEFNYALERTVMLEEYQALVVDFVRDRGGFVLRSTGAAPEAQRGAPAAESAGLPPT